MFLVVLEQICVPFANLRESPAGTVNTYVAQCQLLGLFPTQNEGTDEEKISKILDSAISISGFVVWGLMHWQ